MEGNRDESHLVIGVFALPEVGEAAARDLSATYPHLRSNAALLVREGDGVRTRCFPKESASAVNPVIELIAGAIAGGVLRSGQPFLDVGSDLGNDDMVRFSVELETGAAAVLVLADRHDAELCIVELTRAGGKIEDHRLSDTAETTARLRAARPGR